MVNYKDLKPVLKEQIVKVFLNEGEGEIKFTKPSQIERDVMVSTVIRDFVGDESLQFKKEVLKTIFIENFSDFQAWEEEEEVDLQERLDRCEPLFNVVETVGFYKELEFVFDQQFNLDYGIRNSAAYGVSVLVLFLENLVEAFSTKTAEKADDTAKEATTLLQTLEQSIQKGEFSQTVDLLKEISATGVLGNVSDINLLKDNQK